MSGALNTKMVALLRNAESPARAAQKPAAGKSTAKSPEEIYFAQIRKIKVLSSGEEAALRDEWQELKTQNAALAQDDAKKNANDQRIAEIKNKLFKHNLRFVVKIAKGYQCKGLPLLDLINEGNIGLEDAIERFDPARGVKICSYAVWWIRQGIDRAVAKTGNTIRLPQRKIDMIGKIFDAKRRLARDGKEHDESAIANYWGWAPETVASVMQYANRYRPISLQKITRTDKDYEATLEDIIADESYDNPDEATMKSVAIDSLSKALSVLTEIERRIVELRYQLNVQDSQDSRKIPTFKEIGKIVKLSPERVRQILEKAMGKLRKKLNSADIAPNSRP